MSARDKAMDNRDARNLKDLEDTGARRNRNMDCGIRFTNLSQMLYMLAH